MSTVRTPNIYRAFPAICGILTSVENVLVKPRDIDIYMAPDDIAAFRAGLSDRELGAWREFWNKKPPSFTYLGLAIKQDVDGGNEAPTVHWLGVPVMTIQHDPDPAKPLAGDYAIRAINQYPDLSEAEWFGAHRLWKQQRGVMTSTQDFAIPCLRPQFLWAKEDRNEHAKPDTTHVTAQRLVELGLVTRKPYNPTNEEKTRWIWDITHLGKNAVRQFLVSEVIKRRAKV